jgi:DNA primase
MLIFDFTDDFLNDLRARLPVSAVVGQSHKLIKQGAEFVAIDDP